VLEDSLCSNSVKAVERLVTVVLVSEAGAFNQHREAVVVVEVATTLVTIKPIKLCQRGIHAIQHGVEETLAASNDGEAVPHVHHLLHSINACSQHTK